jgi:tetratricopeptide (TPR) repeat protein
MERHRLWGEPARGRLATAWHRIRVALGIGERRAAETLPRLPLALRRGELAAIYLGAEAAGDHRRAAAAAIAAADSAAAREEWWPADIWAHRSLWHFEQAEMTLQAARAARRIGEIRTLAGDPASARRYYAEAISEARDIGAEREEGLAALGMGQAQLQLGDVTTARRLAQISIDLLQRAGAPPQETEAAQRLRGVEKRVGTEGER